MKFRPNPHFDREFSRTAGARAHIRRRAEAARRFAIGSAPRGATDDYATSIDVVERGTKTYVRTNDFAGHMVEFGSVNNPPYAPIRKGVRAAGLRLDETQQ